MALSPPNKIVIDFLEGVSSRADAVAYARGFISSHFDVPEQSGYFVTAYKDGYAFEVHEGGSRLAYLPSILRRLEENPDATISIRSGARVLQVSKGARDSFNSLLLPEELSSYLENVIEPDDKAPHLTPYQIDNVVWLLTGMTTLGVGLFILLFSMGFYLLGPKPSRLVAVNSTPVAELPISQWNKMVGKLDSDHYISQMKFDNDNWSFDVLANDVAPKAAADLPQGPIIMTAPNDANSKTPPINPPPVVAPAPAKGSPS